MPNLTDRFLEGNGTGYIEAGLPNITGTIYGEPNTGIAYTSSGALYLENSATTSGGSSSGYYSAVKIDASRSSSIYGNSTTVQPATCKCNFVIKY